MRSPKFMKYGVKKMKIKEGQSYHLFFSENNFANKIINVRKVVDKEWIVYRHRIKYDAPWVYEVKHIGFFELLESHGDIKALV